MTNDSKKTKAELIAEIESMRACLDSNATANASRPASEDDKYKQILDGLPQMVYEFDRNGVLVYANDHAMEVFGYKHTDAVGKLHVQKIIHPSDLQRAVENMEKAMAGAGSQGEEYLALHQNGSTFPIKIFSQGVFERGVPVGVRGTVIDITEIRETQQALVRNETFYRTMFEATGTAMCTFGDDAVITSCNGQFEKLSGYTRSEILGIMKWSDMVDPVDLQRIQAYHAQRLKEGNEAPREYDFTFLAKDEVRKEVHLVIELVPGTDNRVCSLMDMTARLRAEKALRESEKRYELVVHGANDGIWDWDLVTDEVYYSPRYKAILGYADDEFPNNAAAWKGHVHPEDLERVVGVNMQCVEGKTDHFEVEYRMRHKDGSYRWILGRGAAVRDEDGSTRRMAGTHTDVTDRHRAEERTRELIENASDGIYQATPDGRFITINSSMARIMGYDSPEQMMQTVNDIRTQLYANPDDREQFMRDLLEKRTLHNYELHLTRRDGSKVWVSENIRAVFDMDDELLYYEGFLQDITARKLNERTTRAMYAISKAISTTRDLRHLYEHIHSILDEHIDATNFFIAMYDEPRDRIVFPYFADEKDEYYDIRNVSAPSTRSLSVHVLRTEQSLLLSQSNPEHVKRHLEIGVIGTPAAVWLGVPLRLKDKTIGTMAVQHYSNPHHYSEAEVTFMEAVSEQVAMAIERKANEEELTTLNEELESKVEQRTAELSDKAVELEAANKRLTELDEIKSALVSSISHELRTPLTSIRGFAKLTGKEFLRHFAPLSDTNALDMKSKRIRQNLEIIENEGERLTRLINDFLDISSIESGRTIWNDSFLNPCHIIKQAVKTVAGAFTAKPDVALVADLPASIPPIHADPDKIHQVLINLLGNACKFTSEGKVGVSVTTNLDTLTITVADTGMGIPKDEQAHIFEKFHKIRAGDTISIKDKGTGLGLAICREIVEHYGGSIWVDSTPDAGSSFSFTLPTVPGSETACS